ncbi:MAG: 2-amino-4-hydroxy-6-hydroxymethyldihydropteridine diphosphokinase [Clostridium sp.]|nr:2-amino-4-hydroxy-6-hydroxymethyldihydropteridine diphosphokinase [Clostridium sp.]
MNRVHLNIGSNLGDRQASLWQAVAGIFLSGCFGEIVVSEPVVSEPWGYESSNPYLNIGLMTETDLEPLELLALLQEIERSVSAVPHRAADGSYLDRAIDIDIISYGDVVTDTPVLTLPHPRMDQRMFVLRPLSELDPDWRHPVSGMTAGELIERLGGIE